MRHVDTPERIPNPLPPICGSLPALSGFALLRAEVRRRVDEKLERIFETLEAVAPGYPLTRNGERFYQREVRRKVFLELRKERWEDLVSESWKRIEAAREAAT